MASDQPAPVDGQEADGGEGGGDEEEAVVEESDLARLYEDRDSQDATRRLPEFQGTVPGLTGKTTTPRERALTKAARQAGSGGGGGVPLTLGLLLLGHHQGWSCVGTSGRPCSGCCREKKRKSSSTTRTGGEGGREGGH